jgi:AraC family transcriptional regulator
MVPRKLRRVLEFVDANLDQDIGLDDLARIAELSPFHFSRVFKLATGSSPYHYVRDRRLKRSRLLLAEGRLGIAELALACGFANQSHFTAAFTKAMGVSPGRFRRQTAV